MPVIFLSYRRADTGGYAGRLAESLERRFGRGSVFQDVEAIAPGSDFAQAIAAAIARCQVVLVLLGDTWLTERDAHGRPRLEDPQDFVRLEVASALQAGTPVLPVLVEGGRMPAANELPSDLRHLARLQALELSDTRWEYDVERLANAVRRITGSGPAPGRRRRLLFAGAGIVAAVAAAVAGYIVLTRPASLAGRWDLADGSFWSIAQDGADLTIEETHYQSKQVWKRGKAVASSDRVAFVLDLVYGGPRRWEGSLQLAWDGSALSGEIRDAASGEKRPLVLTRAR